MPGKPYLVGIVGGSASGKTSFLNDLRSRLPENQCAIVSQDNYYRPIHEQARDVNNKPNFDLPTAIYYDGFRDDLATLVRGETISRNEYTFNHRERQGRIITVAPATIILVEGLFLFHYEEIRDLLALRVFIDAKPEICKARRLERDARERGYPAEHVEYQWEQHVVPAYQKFILPYRDEAHVIVANHGDYSKGLEVVADHLLARLQ